MMTTVRFELSNVRTNQGKKRQRKRELFDSTVSNLGPKQEGAFPSVLVVEDSSVRDASSDQIEINITILAQTRIMKGNTTIFFS